MGMFMQQKSKKVLRGVVAAWAVCLGVSAVYAADPAPQAFKIEPQPVSTALKAFAAQSNMQLIFTEADVGAAKTNGVSGTKAPREALSEILRGTGLKFEFTANNVVVVKKSSREAKSDPPSGEDQSTNEKEGKTDSSRDFRVAQVDQAATGVPAVTQSGQGAPKSGVALEEIVVTAQKRQERLQDVPISISVLRGSDLDKSTAEGISEELSRVPGVSTSLNVQGGGTQVTIRGVTASDALFIGSSPIAYYLDSVPFGLIKTAIAPDSNAFDLERVEVMRGPEGTLYGASALNGVVRVLTHDADLDNFDLKTRVADSNTDGGGNNYRGDVAVNIPIIDGKLAVRAVVGYENQSGWIDSANQNRVNNAELRNYRLKVNAQPTDELSIGLSAWSSRDNYGAPSTAGQPLRSTTVLPQPITTDYDTYGLKIGYDFSHVSISSMTSYLHYKNDGYLDLTSFGVPDPFFTGLDSKVFSQEINLSSKSLGPWRWTAGGIYRDAKDHLLQAVSYLPAPVDYSDGSNSFAVFGEIGRRFLEDKFELTLGLRHYHENVSNRENVQDEGLLGVPLYRASASANATTPRVVLTWYPNSDLTAYASYSEGFRGGFPQNANVEQTAPGFPALKPDKLRNYEIGAKGSLFEKRLDFDAALYYIHWTGVQQILRVDINGIPASAPVNGSSASGLGADLSVTTQPVKGLQLGISASWNGLGWDENKYFNGALLFAKGDRLNYSPEYTIGPLISYVVHLGGSGLDGRFSASANYTSKQFLSDFSAGTRTLESGDDMFVARTSVAISSTDRWTATIYADNVTNEHGTTINDAYGVPDWSPRIRPRTVGMQLEYRYR